MMMPVGLTDAPYALQRVLVPEMPAEGVARVGRISDDAAATDDVRRPADEPHLGIDWMQFEIFAHSPIENAPCSAR